MNKNPIILIYTQKAESIIGYWKQYHIYDELEFHECTVYEYDTNKYDSVAEANKQLLHFVDKNSVDLLMTDYNEELLYIDTLIKIKEKGIKTLLFCPVNIVMPYYHKKIARYFDLIWVTADETKHYYERLNKNVIFMPFAANPNMKHHIKKETHGICFIGTPYGSRTNVFNNLTKNGIDVYCTYQTDTCSTVDKKIEKKSLFDQIDNIFQHALFSQGRKLIIASLKNRFFLHTKLDINNNLKLIKTVSNDKVYEAYANYSLCFSSTTAAHTGVLKYPVYICNLRSFEIPMSGGVIFAQYNPELDSYFKDGVEAVYYHNKKDMIEKAKYYLDDKHRDELVAIKYNARKKAEKYHTWWVRFKAVFDNLSIKYTDK